MSRIKFLLAIATIGVVAVTGILFVAEVQRGDNELDFEASPVASPQMLSARPLASPRSTEQVQNERAFVQRLVLETQGSALTHDDDWTPRGPFEIGGRTRALAIDVSNEDNVLAGSTTSGMFKSTDGGASWTKTTTPDQLHGATAIAQNRANGRENIWYVGTGWGSGGLGTPLSTTVGDGIFKSTDSGDSWTLLESTTSGTPHEVDDFDLVFDLETFGDDGVVAATLTGILVSSDGGSSWTMSLATEDDWLYFFTDIAISDAGIWYATIGGDGPNHGIYRSEDEGQSWQIISPDGWPASTFRTIIDVAPSNQEHVYFFSEVGSNTQLLWRYEEGAGWTDLSAGLPFDGHHVTYDGKLMVLAVKPDDEQTIFIGGIDLFRSTNGGASFEVINGLWPNFHVDQTSLVFLPSDPKRMVVGNDGGLFSVSDNTVGTDALKSQWTPMNDGYRTTQFYTIGLDRSSPGDEFLIGGTQDHGVVVTGGTDDADSWQVVFGGDGGYVDVVDGGELLYAAQSATFALWRLRPLDNGAYERTAIRPTGGRLGIWLNRFVLDPHDQKVMYLPSRRTLWRNSDLTAIPYEQGAVSTTVNWDTLENLTPAHYIQALGMSEAEPRRLYYVASDDAATADGKIFYIDNPHEGQPVPVEITGENLPFYPYVPWIDCIAVDPRDVDKVIIVFPQFNQLSLFATDDAGATWTPVAGNLEENPDGTGSGPAVRWVSILYVDDQPVYLAGTSAGLFSATNLDGMNTKWIPEARSTIGNISIGQIAVRQSDGFVAVATYGNGVYTTYITQVPTAVEETELPTESFELVSVYPNPLHQVATVRFRLSEPAFATARVVDLQGRSVGVLEDGWRSAGDHEVRWDAAGVASGVYFIELEVDGSRSVEKVVVQK